MIDQQIDTEQLGKMTAYDEFEHPVRLADLWNEHIAVLVFVRHFGWVFCRQQVAELAQHHNLFSDRHAKLVIIGSGEPSHLKELRQTTGYSGDLLTDPSLESYKILGFTSGVSKILGLKAISRGFSALRAGHKPGTIQGSALQLGGAIIVKSDGTVAYYFASEEAGDHPPIADLLEALPAKQP